MYYSPRTVTSHHYCLVLLLLLLTMLTISYFVCNHNTQVHFLLLSLLLSHEFMKPATFLSHSLAMISRNLLKVQQQMFSVQRRNNNLKSYLEIWSQAEAWLSTVSLDHLSAAGTEQSSCHGPSSLPWLSARGCCLGFQALHPPASLAYFWELWVKSS